MDITIISIFPEMFDLITRYGVIGRAVQRGQLNLKVVNPRDYADNKHRTVDDRPYGGGPGMLMMPAPLAKAIAAAKADLSGNAKVIYLSPQGKTLNQAACERLSEQVPLILLAGRYEGVDQRVIDLFVDEQWSIGDYVLSGGELPAMVLIDAICRLAPNTLGNAESIEQDSFIDGLLDCPHYTRPEEFEGQRVPAVLLSGDHQQIELWRLKQKLGITWQERPDLLAQKKLTALESELLKEFITEIESRTSSDGDM